MLSEAATGMGDQMAETLLGIETTPHVCFPYLLTVPTSDQMAETLLGIETSAALIWSGVQPLKPF
jgi:hypothetical protein